MAPAALSSRLAASISRSSVAAKARASFSSATSARSGGWNQNEIALPIPLPEGIRAIRGPIFASRSSLRLNPVRSRNRSSERVEPRRGVGIVVLDQGPDGLGELARIDRQQRVIGRALGQ